MIKHLVALAFLFATVLSFAQTIDYKLSMSKPQNHYFEVEMAMKNVKTKATTVKMPVWSPGSYLVREFAKNVNIVTATAPDGTLLKVNKTSKNAWKVENGKYTNFKVNYEVYSFELSVRTSFLDLTHGFVSGSGIFMYTEESRNNKGNLTIVPHSNFSKITTALEKAGESEIGDGAHAFSYTNYDQLVDCPIEIGNQETFDFTAAGVKHNVAIYGPGSHDIDQLKIDMKKIVEAATDVFGQNPNKEYTFIIHNVVDGQGGLEHTNSTTLSVNRWTYGPDDYLGFISLVAHEYFHLWNVKRIRPVELGPFNYDEENYTSLLWVMEGFTSYYDELLLLRAGYYDQNTYMRKLESTINYVEGSPGARVQPVAHASFDAWIKAYRPNENSGNTTMTYYSRGQMLAATLDAMIIKKYNGKKCLDHFMRQLYSNYYEKKGRGFSESEFKQELENFLGENMTQFFDDYVNGTKIVDFNKYFEPVGIAVENISVPAPDFGASLSENGGKVVIRRIRSESPAENGGLSVNDEIIGCNGFRINKNEFENFIGGLGAGESMTLLISRDDILYEVIVKMEDYSKPRFTFYLNNDDDRESLRNYWLRTN